MSQIRGDSQETTLNERAVGKRAVTAQERGEILQRLGRAWDDRPSLRLGQLIQNVFNNHSLYYVEDYDLVQLIDEFYGDMPRVQ